MAVQQSRYRQGLAKRSDRGATALTHMEQVVETSGSATPAQIKAKFGDVERAWAQVTQKYEVAKPEYQVTLRSNMASVDDGSYSPV